MEASKILIPKLLQKCTQPSGVLESSEQAAYKFARKTKSLWFSGHQSASQQQFITYSTCRCRIIHCPVTFSNVHFFHKQLCCLESVKPAKMPTVWIVLSQVHIINFGTQITTVKSRASLIDKFWIKFGSSKKCPIPEARPLGCGSYYK